MSAADISRKIERLIPKVEREQEADHQFFEAYPHRQYRVRPVYPNESALARVAQGEVAPGWRRYMVIKRFESGELLTIGIDARADLPTDADDAHARHEFERAAAIALKGYSR